MTPDPRTKSTGELLTDILDHLSNLVRGEVALARAEVEENVRAAGTGVGLVLAAAVIATTALNVLTGALVAGLTELGLAAGWSALAVGILFALIAFLLARKGAAALKPSSLAPDRTMRNVRRDAQTLKEIVK
ncbi:phage holin family protein [Frigidibacter sp. SD6-1]|uniref:phage holin family protein n=1 Tax=Frigidibacter sp. SD6-1 TaxID=3032581 RepID=UPI0024DFA5AE|nr:phage holin family protein [Frigidibacter sp. SD6-1]